MSTALRSRISPRNSCCSPLIRRTVLQRSHAADTHCSPSRNNYNEVTQEFCISNPQGFIDFTGKRSKRVMCQLGRSVSWCVLTLILAVTSFASTSSTATLTGRVIDPNGGVIVGARVEATNIATNVVSSTETNSEGLFVIANLLPGRYRVSVQKQGFQMIIEPEVELHVQDVLSLNFSMPLGSITQSEPTCSMP